MAAGQAQLQPSLRIHNQATHRRAGPPAHCIMPVTTGAACPGKLVRLAPAAGLPQSRPKVRQASIGMPLYAGLSNRPPTPAETLPEGRFAGPGAPKSYAAGSPGAADGGAGAGPRHGPRLPPLQRLPSMPHTCRCIRARQQAKAGTFSCPLHALLAAWQLAGSPQPAEMQGPVRTAGYCPAGPCSSVGRHVGRCKRSTHAAKHCVSTPAGAQTLHAAFLAGSRACRARTCCSGWQSCRPPMTRGWCR